MDNADFAGLDAPRQQAISTCPRCAQQTACDLASHVPHGAQVCAAALTKRHALARGDLLFRQGNPSAAVYLVRKGSVKTERVTQDGHLVVTSFLFPGDLVGLDAIAGARHTTDAVTLETSEVCEFAFERLLSLCQQDAEVNAWLIGRIGCALQERDTALCCATRMKCCDRLLRFFIALYDRLVPHARTQALSVRMPMTKHDIAMHLHMSAETLSRTLGELRQAGLLHLKGQTFALPNLHRAKARARL